MSFDSGTISFRLFHLQQPRTPRIIEALAKRAAPPIDTLDRDPISGWASGQSPLDRNITDQKCVIGPYLHVQWMKAEKKIPASLLKAHLKQEEEAERNARGVAFLPRIWKAAIKTRVIAELQPKMQPTLTTIPAALNLISDLLIATALSDNQIDTLCQAIKTTTGAHPILITPETAALKRKNINARDLPPTVFSPDPAINPTAEPTLGMDFLTWLWYTWEKEARLHRLPDGRTFGFILEGPVTFYHQGQGAHEVALRHGIPLNSREAGTTLLCGKKLKRAKIIIAHNDGIYTATLDDTFAIRSLKLPKGE